MNWLYEADIHLLYFLNGGHTSFLDEFMWLLSARLPWILFYLGLLACVLKSAGIKITLTFLAILILTIVLTDQISATLIRPIVMRLRPSNLENPISSAITVVNEYRGGRYGFPSCHAANSVGVMTLTSLFFKNRIITVSMLVWAMSICYSRIYLGVHYPSDILGGILIGVLIGLFCYTMVKKVGKFEVISDKYVWIVPATLAANITALAIWSI